MVTTRESATDWRALPVVAFGLLVAVAPVALAPFPGEGGSFTLAVRIVQTVVALVGLGVTSAGYHAYRTGDLRPVVAVGTATGGLAALGVVRLTVGRVVGWAGPPWAWVLTAALVLGFAGAWAYRPPPPDMPPPRW